MHQPERGGVEDEPHLICGGAVTRHAVRRQLRLVQLDQLQIFLQNLRGCFRASQAARFWGTPPSSTIPLGQRRPVQAAPKPT
jgi:hypothetical protein